jgi:DNA damage-inducible protein 1
LFGLDMLKAHQAIIDLQKNVLRIQGREVKFLAEHELPDKARVNETAEIDDTPPGPSNPAPTRSGGSSGPSQFPGSGHTLRQNPRPQPASQANPTNTFPERDIATLVGLGVSREVAIRTLQAAGGNVDIAASLLF